MADTSLISIARPYAKAAFDYAVKKKDLESWSALLNQATLVVKDKTMHVLLKDPRLDKMVAYECLLTACKPWIFRSGRNFLKLIALHQRLLVLPEIEQLFEQYKAERANQIIVQATSAIPLTEIEDLALRTVLKKRLQQEVKLDYVVDDSLLGGFVVRVGDLVIDSSVRGKLERLRATLVN